MFQKFFYLALIVILMQGGAMRLSGQEVANNAIILMIASSISIMMELNELIKIHERNSKLSLIGIAAFIGIVVFIVSQKYILYGENGVSTEVLTNLGEGLTYFAIALIIYSKTIDKHRKK